MDKLLPHPSEEERHKSSSTEHPPAQTGEGYRRRPLQQYLAGECVSSIATFHHTNTLVLAGTSSKMIKCVDLRASGQGGGGAAAGAGGNGGEGNLAFSIPTRSIFNLCTSVVYPYLFASSEDGLSGVVKLWDTRFLRSNFSHPGLLNNDGAGFGTGLGNSGSMAEEVCSYAADGLGGVVALRWDQRRSERGGQRLGIGTKEGGVVMYDVLSGETVDAKEEEEGFGNRGARAVESAARWTTLAGVKNSKSTRRNRLLSN